MSNIITTLLSALLATAAALGVVTAIRLTALGQAITGPRATVPANANSLLKRIAKLDQLLAHLFYRLIIAVGLSLTMIALLDISGLFDYMGWW